MAQSKSQVEPRELPRPPRHRQPQLIRRMFAGPAPVLDELAERFGPDVALGGGPVRMAIIGDPRTLRELFALPEDNFRWGHRFNLLGFIVGDKSMIVSDGADHKRRRSSVQSAFSRRRLNGWIPMIVDRTDTAIDALTASVSEPEQVVDMYRFGRSLVLDIVVRSMFGDRLAVRATEIGELFQGPQDYLEAPAIRQIPHPFPRTTRSRARADRVAIDEIIDEQMRHLRAQPVAPDPLDVLATLVAEDTLDDDEIRDQVATLMGAGYDTTAASLSWMFWNVSLCPGLWGRLREEADRVLGPVGQSEPPTAATLAALDLANRTMRETTRLHPAGVISPRETMREIVVGGYRIPKHTLVLWSAHLAGRSSDVWEQPLHFDPDRFLETDADQDALATMAWVPFGRGTRNCIGFALAQMELTLIISRVAQRLDVAATATAKPGPVGMVVNRPAGGAPMRVAAREATAGNP